MMVKTQDESRTLTIEREDLSIAPVVAPVPVPVPAPAPAPKKEKVAEETEAKPTKKQKYTRSVEAPPGM